MYLYLSVELVLSMALRCTGKKFMLQFHYNLLQCASGQFSERYLDSLYTCSDCFVETHEIIIFSRMLLKETVMVVI